MTHVMAAGPAARKERQHATEAPKRVIAVWHGSKAGSHPLKGLYGASGGPWVRNSTPGPFFISQQILRFNKSRFGLLGAPFP